MMQDHLARYLRPRMIMKSAVWTTVFFLLFLTSTELQSEAQQFTIEPESVVQAEGLLAKFECLSPGVDAHAWLVNGIASESLTSIIRVVEGSEGRPSVLTIPASSQFNNSVVQCAAASLSGVVFSKNVILIVERVSIDVVNDETSITISVTNNFTMKTLNFRVDISLTTLGTNEMVALPPLNGGQNQTQFNYRQPDNHTICDIFTFTVIPFSESGMEGRSSEPVTGFFTTVSVREKMCREKLYILVAWYLTVPVSLPTKLSQKKSGMEGRSSEPDTGFFTTASDNNNVAPLISQEGNVLRKIVHLGDMVPNCTNFTSYQVTSDISEPINKTFEDPQIINVSLPTDRIIIISVTLTSITGVRLIFKDLLIRTTDVQDLIVDVCPKENCASIEYVEGTLSPGALLCVIRIIHGELNFQSTRLLPIRRNMSDNFTIPVAVGGNYTVIAFDLENNSMSVPRMPISVAADDETMFLSNEYSTEPNSPPNSENITVTKLSNGSAEVTCTTSGHSCLALFHSKTSPTSLDPMVMIGFIEPPNDRTTVTLSTTSDVYVVVYTWNSDSGETIFDGKVSFITQLELPTSPPSTQSPPDTTGSPAPSPILVTVLIIGAVLFIAIFIVGILYLVKRFKRRNYKVVHSSPDHCQFESNSQGRSTNRASHELHSRHQGKGIPLYDVARPQNMSLEHNTADTDVDAPPPGYDIICKENMQPECKTVRLVLAGKAMPTTSENPPPLPPPMLRGDKGLDNNGVLTEETTSTSQAKDERTEDESDGRLETKIAAQDTGASITYQVAFYDVARPENMSLGFNTADTDDILPPGYDVVRAENMPSPEYETVPLVQAAKHTFTSDNPPPLPPLMIRGDSEAPDLPPPYNPAVDNESVGVMSVESSISHGQSVDEEVDESVERDLSVSTVEHDGTTEEAIGSTEAQLDVDTVRGAEGGAGNNDHSEQEAMIAVQLVEHKPIDKVIMKDSSKVGYSKVDNDKLKPVVPPPALLPRQRPPPPPPTHETLMDLLHSIHKKWEDIAKALNIDEDRVDEIFTNNENEYLRLYKLMEYYFTSVHCSHSWEEMVRVLTEIGEHGLAGRIKAEKIQDQDAHDADSYLKAVEANNCDESTQASVRGNELKVVPPTQNGLSHPQVVAPLPIEVSNQSSVKENENDENQSENVKNQLNVTKLVDTQLGHDRSMIVPPQPNYVTPSLL